MGLVGPALAGALIALVSTGPAFVIDAASFGWRGWRRSSSPADAATRDPAAQGDRPTMLSAIGGGVRAAWADPAVRSIVVLIAAFNIAFTGPISVGLAFLADHRFSGGSAAFGFLFSAFDGGAVIGAIVAGSISRPPTSARSSWPSPDSRRVPDDLRGRVMSLVTLGSVGLAPLSLAIAGALIDLGAVTLAFVTAGAIVIVAALAGVAWRVPTLMAWPEDDAAQPTS